MSERDHGERAGRAGAGPRKPSRRMRERADEMADLLAMAAPKVQKRRSSRSAAIPAAVAALGALTVGGVGVAVSLDTQAADAGIALPLPSGPESGAGTTPDPEVRVTTSAVADVPLSETGTSERSERPTRPTSSGRPPGAIGPAPVAAGPQRPRATTTTRADEGTDVERPRETTSSRSTTTPSTSTRNDESDGSDDSSNDRGRPGRSGVGNRADDGASLRADSRGSGRILPSASPTVDEE